MVRIRWNPPDLNDQVAWEKRVGPERDTETRHEDSSMRTWCSSVRAVSTASGMSDRDRNLESQRRRPASSASIRGDPGVGGASAESVRSSRVALVKRGRGIDAPSKVNQIVWPKCLESKVNDR